MPSTGPNRVHLKPKRVLMSSISPFVPEPPVAPPVASNDESVVVTVEFPPPPPPIEIDEEQQRRNDVYALMKREFGPAHFPPRVNLPSVVTKPVGAEQPPPPPPRENVRASGVSDPEMARVYDRLENTLVRLNDTLLVNGMGSPVAINPPKSKCMKCASKVSKIPRGSYKSLFLLHLKMLEYNYGIRLHLLRD